MENNTAPIRVLHVVQRMEAAGLQSFIMNIYRSIDRNKVQFDFLTHYTNRYFYDDEIESMGGRIYRLSVRENYNFAAYWFQLCTFFKNHPEYQIVHGHMDSLGFMYLAAAKRADVPVRIAHAHNYIDAKGIKGIMRGLTNRFYKYPATELLSCSKKAGNYMFGTSSFCVVNNAIDTDKFAYSKATRARVRKNMGVESNFVIGHVGRIEHQKNHAFLIDIFAQIKKIKPESVLLLVGDGSLKNEIKVKARNEGVMDSLCFLGIRNDTNELYQAMDVFIFPSLYEGLGIAAIEAQTAGLLTVCSDKLPDEASITSNYHTMSLSSTASEWARWICHWYTPQRKDCASEIVDAGFDANSNKMQDFYLQNVR